MAYEIDASLSHLESVSAAWDTLCSYRFAGPIGEMRLSRNSCRPLKRTRFLRLRAFTCRHLVAQMNFVPPFLRDKQFRNKFKYGGLCRFSKNRRRDSNPAEVRPHLCSGRGHYERCLRRGARSVVTTRLWINGWPAGNTKSKKCGGPLEQGLCVVPYTPGRVDQNPRPFDRLRAGSVAQNATRAGHPLLLVRLF